MNTNIDFFAAGHALGQTIGETVSQTLDGYSDSFVSDQVPTILSVLGGLFVGILVIGGLYWVVRRLIKAYRATR